MQIVIDYETRSECDLKKRGAHVYAKDPTTEILCMGYKIGDLAAKVWVPSQGPIPKDFLEALPNAVLVAHNAQFERVITRHVLSRTVGKSFHFTSQKWKCTAAKAAAHSLPRSLEEACLALKLPIQKDMEGRRLILKYCKPRRATKNNQNLWFDNPNELARIYQYCATDVEAEYLLDKALPDLCQREVEIWNLDQKINDRGIPVDVALCDKAIETAEIESLSLNQELHELTFGAIRSIGQVQAITKYLQGEGAEINNLAIATVESLLDSPDLSDRARRILEIRAAVSKSSVKKYQSLVDRSSMDERVRGAFLYHGASTGRWTGAGIQPQNFPRGKLKDTTHAIDCILNEHFEITRFLYGDYFTLLSNCLRGAIKAKDGYRFLCSDFATVEVRVLFWMARHEAGLQALRDGQDLYKMMARTVFGIPIDKINPFQRQVGKTIILGCGYQMGGPKFHQTCLQQKIEGVDEELAAQSVAAYRELHFPIPKMWYNMEKAAMLAVSEGKRITVNRVTWFVQGKFLYCQLPSGRRIAYYGPEIKSAKTSWGEPKMSLYHWSMNSQTKKWESKPTYGGRLTENVVQATARDFMAEAALRVENVGYPVILTSHDELLAEVPEDFGSLKQFENLMSFLPEWGDGCPIRAEGWEGKRYKK